LISSHNDFSKNNMKTTKIYSEIHNLENLIQVDQYFSSCGHMNDVGARMFTAIVINKFFETKQKQ
jgi:hypothetical protein